MTPPLPQLVSMPAAAWRSRTVTSWPAFIRYHAVAVPTAPAPSTIVAIALAPVRSSARRGLAALAAGARCRNGRLRGLRARHVGAARRGAPHRLALALDAA